LSFDIAKAYRFIEGFYFDGESPFNTISSILLVGSSIKSITSFPKAVFQVYSK